MKGMGYHLMIVETEFKIAGLIALETLSNFDRYRDVVKASRGHIGALMSSEAQLLLGEKFVEKLEYALSNKEPQHCEKIDAWANAEITVIPLGGANYPALLTEMSDPPPLLWVRGNYLATDSQSWLGTKKLFTIVGSRKASIEACDIACSFAEQMVEVMPIVSGLALGIDAAAHKGSLRKNGVLPGVAVLGSGVDMLYPARNAALGQQLIEAGGIIVSQFLPGTPPFPSNFLNRNRVIAGLSTAGLIVQAGARSGSLNTARHLVEQGKDVFVVPGSIRYIGYEGSHSLLKEGAILVTSPHEILEHLGFVTNVAEIDCKNGDVDGSCAVTKALSDGALSVVELQELLGASVPVLSRLIELELKGSIVSLPGDRYGLALKARSH
jgi:DNA processing protein